MLLDTNILLRRAQPSHHIAVESVARCLTQNVSVYFTPQNISEFWNVATRPVDKNGLGLSPEIVISEIQLMEELLTLLPDSPAVYGEWKRLVTTHKVLGSKVYDARLVATMHVYGVTNILTFNTADFKRYSDINVIDPSSLIS